jgi:beta-phosphoglucomutase
MIRKEPLVLSEIAVLWDMDGTFLDSNSLHFQIWQQMLEPTVPGFSRQSFKRVFGTNNRQSLAAWFGRELAEDELQDLSNRKEAIFQERMAEGARLFPGVLNWMEYLHANGVKQAIASSAPAGNIDTAVETFNLGYLFQAIVSGSKLPAKPAPDVFLKAAEALAVEPSRCVVFEDSIHGLEGAKAAGMLRVAKLNSLIKLEKSDADLFVSEYTQDPEPFFKDVLKLLNRN